MSSNGRWRFKAFFIIFLTFLPMNLNSQETAEVFDSCQDHLLIQSRDYVNRRSLIDISLPDNGPIVDASPPSPESTASSDPSSPPASDEPPQTPLPPPLPPPLPSSRTKKKSSNVYMIVGIVVGVLAVSGGLTIFFLVLNRKIPIKPWTSSNSHHQEAPITDVQRLQLSELQAACEDFSNIIGSFSDGTVYKGTLPTRAEIAVVSIAAKSRSDWSTSMETELLQKMRKLSKVDHKNFLNMIGYCHENEPFARMLVFEYAPNGSLFEHLHTQHADHLDWPTRLRIVMGIAYCLDHMHNLNPPVLHTNLDSSSIYLTEDNAAKVSDFSIIHTFSPAKEGSSSKRSLLEGPLLDPKTDVFNFGVIVFEIITGKLLEPESLFLVDQSLKPYEEDVAERVLEVVRRCTNPYETQRLTMRDVVVKLREITGITEEAAMPRGSPRWWTELEIISTEGN